MIIQSLKSTFVAIVLTIGTILASAPAAYAATPVPSTPLAEEERQLAELQQAGEQRYQAIQRMEQYLRVHSDGTFYLTVQRGAHIGVEETLFQELQQGMEAVNDLIRSGKFHISEVQTQTPQSAVIINSGRLTDSSIDSCSGRTDYELFWWGVRIFLNSCATQQLLSGASICFIIPIPGNFISCGLLLTWMGGAIPRIAVASTSGTDVWIDVNLAFGITDVQPQ
ncbi:MAG: hypothetical protein GFH27_549311n135 [Chloroflexi bacterium AL-W]|nr:hypothetical protein [Chloroflexi bacterium AL-N1]NOK68687.1 hypothetical protein [Chloroflexi bacterium AL-N10]NOK76173.1 hypothetical protein [Chloroflexi bacterium AL-N5]NOK84190.1 hypothetical protein [Chloroflexi bacterium AL-W]NOK91311.1 hypothetical protein [Chloroflexi bacterium AL-N15]